MLEASNLLTDVDKLASAIRNVFAVEGDLAESDVEKLHVELVGYVEDANARLKHCDELLRRGLRQEALQECEEEPNLLDLVTRLDFPEWDAWADYVIQYALPPQPPLLLDVAAELNEAYSKAQSLDGLLRMHRLHSLARSPLPVRIGVLRNIAAKDPQNPAWRTDLEAYEAARIKQLRAEFSEESARDNLHAVAALRRELDEGKWLTRPPASLMEEVAGGHRRLIAKSARERLAALEPVITAAFSAFDIPAATAARGQWEELWPHAGLPGDGELAMRVRPALDWLDEEQSQETRQAEYQRAMAALEDALNDADATQHRLTRLYHAVEAHEEPIPERIQRRYDERLRSLDVAERRKHRLMLVSGFAAVILIGTVVGIVAFQRARTSEIVATAQSLAKFLDDKQPERAMEFYESRVAAKPYLATAPQIQSLLADVKAELGHESARRDRLAALLEEVEKQVTTITWESVQAAKETMKRAKELARSEGEQVRVLTAERDVGRIEAQLQREADDLFRKDAAVVVAAAQASAGGSRDAVQSLLDDARELAVRKHISATARQASGIDLMVRKLGDQLKSLADNQRRDEALRMVIDAIGAKSAYDRAINSYLIADSASARATDFRDVLAEDLNELGQLSAWNTLADLWNGLSLLSPENAAKALQVIASIEKSYASFPGAASSIELKPYLESVKAREQADGNTLLGELRNILKDDVFAMKQMKHPRGDGYIYYVAALNAHAGVVEVAALEDSRDPTKVVMRKFSLTEFNAANPQNTSRDTPQKALADKANKALSDPKVSYEHIVCSILLFLQSDAQLDPILKCRLLQVFYDRAAPGSSILAEELGGFRAALESKYALEDVDFINFSATYDELPQEDPRVAEAAQAANIRATTADLLQRVPAVRTIYLDQIRPRVDDIANGSKRLPRLQWHASLFKNASGGWSIRLPAGASRASNGTLVVIGRGAGGEPIFETIGTATGGALRLEQLKSPNLREGRPVLLVETQP